VFEITVGSILASVFCLFLGSFGLYLNKTKSQEELRYLKDPEFMKQPHGLGGGSVVAAIRFSRGFLIAGALFALSALLSVLFSKLA
jgi:hypothetical protein